MSKKRLAGLPVLLLIACGESSERYRDTHQLELPPELPIEHRQPQSAVDSEDMKPRASTGLSSLMAFEDHKDKPLLMLKTRPERAWEMLLTALRLENIAIVDKNREQLLFQVRYDADIDGKDVGFLRAMINNEYPEAEYNILLKEEIKGVIVNVVPSHADEVDSDEDASAELLRLLHTTIDAKILNRPPSKAKDE
jgi:uncharacterized lipoprotein